jgi:hypothetical protein
MNGVYEVHRDGAALPEAKETVNRWIMGETARIREEVDAALHGLPLQRRGERPLRLRLGQGLRLVCRVRQAAL